MSPPVPILYFDYVDPLSYLLEGELAAALSGMEGAEVSRVPTEVRPPPGPILDPDGAWWTGRWHAAGAVAATLGRTLVEPGILPWTRKAHELVLHARSHDLEARAHAAVFEAVFARGEDIGRVDVLVGLARDLGLDANEAKVTLDVDRYTGEVAELSSRAAAAGIREIPTLVLGSETLQGFHNRDTVRTFLLR